MGLGSYDYKTTIDLADAGEQGEATVIIEFSLDECVEGDSGTGEVCNITVCGVTIRNTDHEKYRDFIEETVEEKNDAGEYFDDVIEQYRQDNTEHLVGQLDHETAIW